MDIFRIAVTEFGAFVRERWELAAENLALHQPFAILEHKSKRPRLCKRDLIFWAWLRRNNRRKT